MPADGVLRAAETRAVSGLLDAVAAGPAGLVVEGEPGIGKTTLWGYGIDRAVERGFHVLSSRPASSESVLAFACLADLLGTVESDILAALPDPQRHAVDRILLRAGGDVATDRRAVAAALLSVVEIMAADRPVLLAVDDLQWVDAPSVHALEFLARRTTRRVGVLGAVRTSHDTPPVDWLQLPRPEHLRRITLRPLSLGALHTVIADRLGSHFPRPTLLQIYETSGGNPFYALELARALLADPAHGRLLLPHSLTEVVNARLGRFDPLTAEALLAVACLGTPTVATVAEAVATDPAHVSPMLEAVETQGVITFDGTMIRFAHPLLARGVYAGATAAKRRDMHRRLAGIVDETELRARHLALATTSADPTTLRELDAAAELARRRGAPEASAELVALAVQLGGDTPIRVIRLAGYHFNAGDTDRARTLLKRVIDDLPAGELRARAKYLLGAVRMFDDSFPEATGLLRDALAEVGDVPSVRVEMLVLLAFALTNSGFGEEAIDAVEQAVSLAETSDFPALLGQALSMRATLLFMRGDGLDRADLERAVELSERRANVPIAIRPTSHHALLAAWTGDLEVAGRALAEMRQSCLDHGEDSELIFVSFHSALAAIWRADFGSAAGAVQDAAEIAPQLNGDVPRYVALVTSTLLAVYTGRVDEARRDAAESLAAGVRSGAQNLAQWPVMAIGFLETSLERPQEALDVLEPLLTRLQQTPRSTEIIAAWFLPDAIECMVAVGRLDEAVMWADRLVANGTRLDRPWMLAAGQRGRAMVLAARGDYDDALAAAESAVVQHDRIPTPFDRARTRLLVGQLHRRLRRQEAAASAFVEALTEFERLGTPLWAQRARTYLARTNTGPRTHGGDLAPSELRVAQLAATGMTNRDVAAALFISPKTVEANLSRVYRKLGIRSRAELGKRMSELAD